MNSTERLNLITLTNLTDPINPPVAHFPSVPVAGPSIPAAARRRLLVERQRTVSTATRKNLHKRAVRLAVADRS
jgi:hypothetical protein